MQKFIGDWNTILYPTGEEAKEICRIGQGEKACPFLVCGPAGFECWRMNYPSNGILHRRVDEGTMNAKGKECNWDEVASGAMLQETAPISK